MNVDRFRIVRRMGWVDYAATLVLIVVVLAGAVASGLLLLDLAKQPVQTLAPLLVP